jgi:outer membrane protein assembly factor BamB
VIATDGHVFTATGAPWLADYAPDGTLQRRLETGLKAVHLMEFALSPDKSRLYAVSACFPGSSAFASIEIATGTATTAASPACGSAIDATDSSVVVGTTATGRVPSPTRRGKLLALDPSTGAIIAEHPTPSEAVDILAPR